MSVVRSGWSIWYYSGIDADRTWTVTPLPLSTATRSQRAPCELASKVRFVAGIDGGGTTTRARLQGIDGAVLGSGQAGPSGLGQGVQQAWRHVEDALGAAIAAASISRPPRCECALGLGLAGAIRPELATAFLAGDPGYALCVLDTDASTLLLGAHAGRPGIVVIAGTGSVGAARGADGLLHSTGGWGFPVGDEGSGAWLGLHAMQHAQRALDGRDEPGVLAPWVWNVAGREPEALLAWCAAAGQHAYAQLAPLVFDAALQGDGFAQALLQTAADELARLARALQEASAALPIVVGGSVGTRLAMRWPSDLRAHIVAPAGDGLDGALRLVRGALGDMAHAPELRRAS